MTVDYKSYLEQVAEANRHSAALSTDTRSSMASRSGRAMRS